MPEVHVGQPLLADYGIAKLIDNGGSWAPVAGFTFRFDRTPGYTPEKPEEEHALTRDCYAFAAVSLSCVTGRTFKNDDDLRVALEEAPLPSPVKLLLQKCLSDDPTERPPLASVLLEQLQRYHSSVNRWKNKKNTLLFLLSSFPPTCWRHLNLRFAFEKRYFWFT